MFRVASGDRRPLTDGEKRLVLGPVLRGERGTHADDERGGGHAPQQTGQLQPQLDGLQPAGQRRRDNVAVADNQRRASDAKLPFLRTVTVDLSPRTNISYSSTWEVKKKKKNYLWMNLQIFRLAPIIL